MNEQRSAEKDAPCGWCHHPINSKPPFDCRNPMHAERTADYDAPWWEWTCPGCGWRARDVRWEQHICPSPIPPEGSRS